MSGRERRRKSRKGLGLCLYRSSPLSVQRSRISLALDSCSHCLHDYIWIDGLEEAQHNCIIEGDEMAIVSGHDAVIFAAVGGRA